MEVDCHNKLPHHTLTALLIKSLACNIRQQHLVSAYLRGTSQNPRHKNTSSQVKMLLYHLLFLALLIVLYISGITIQSLQDNFISQYLWKPYADKLMREYRDININ